MVYLKAGFAHWKVCKFLPRTFILGPKKIGGGREVGAGIPVNKCRKNDGIWKSLLDHHSNNCFSENPLMNAKISGQKFGKTQHVRVVSKYLPHNICYL